MPDYRRFYAPGGTFFFTVVTAGRAQMFANEAAVRTLRACFRSTQERWPFRVVAMVVLPDHLHSIWALRRDDPDYSTRWAYLKKEFTKRWITSGHGERHTTDSQQKDRRRGIWQRRFWEHTIRDETDFHRHCDYIHYNPVKHGLAKCPHAWAYSSFQRFVEGGFYSQDWCCACGMKAVRAPEWAAMEDTVGE
jgi:putative transposase